MIYVFCKGFENPSPACFLWIMALLDTTAARFTFTFCAVTPTMPLDCLTQLA